MEYFIVSVAALLVSAMALFSGFGLGTLLLPVFAIFFPVPVAVAATAVVHLANNAFRMGLVGRHADWRVVMLFALPAAGAAILGALLLARISDISPLASYHVGDREFTILTVKLVMAFLIAGFAVLELTPALSAWKVDRKYLPFGGLLSGFFGGLSGHQGAFRAPFLSATGLDATGFVGTSAVAAMAVDVARLPIYGVTVLGRDYSNAIGREGIALVAAATAAAFLGTYLGSRYLKKITIVTIRRLVGVLLGLLAVALGTGLV